MTLIRCWEYMKCERQPGGAMVGELGACAGASCPHSECWLIAGTLCNSEVQGTYAQKYESCIICKYYNRMQEYPAKRPQTSFFLFGQYLCRQGLITHDQSIQARSLQLRNNQKIGVLATSRDMLTHDQIHIILIIQEEMPKKFGEVAVELGYLTEARAKDLVLEQEGNYLFFGEALMQLGALNEQTMVQHLKTFNTIKLQKQSEQNKNRSHSAENT